MCSGISVVSTSEIPVVWSDDGIFFTLLRISTIPLTNTRSTSVSKNLIHKILWNSYELVLLLYEDRNAYGSSEVSQSFGNSITFDCSTDLFRSRSYIEWNLRFNSMPHRLQIDYKKNHYNNQLSYVKSFENLNYLFHDASTSSHIFIWRICAWTDETDLDFIGPVVLLGSFSQFRDRMG